MDLAGDEFFAGPALAGDHDRKIVACVDLRGPQDRLQCLAPPDDCRRGPDFFQDPFQLHVLSLVFLEDQGSAQGDPSRGHEPFHQLKIVGRQIQPLPPGARIDDLHGPVDEPSSSFRGKHRISVLFTSKPFSTSLKWRGSFPASAILIFPSRLRCPRCSDAWR